MKSLVQVFRSLAVPTMACWMVAESALPQQPPAQPLFTPVAAAAPAKGSKHRKVIRSRTVKTDVAKLRSAQPERAGALAFNLFNDALLSGVVEHREDRSPGDHTIRGRLVEDDRGRFCIVIRKGVIAGFVWSVRRGKVYRLNSAADDTLVISEVDYTRCGGCGVGPAHGVAHGRLLLGADVAAVGTPQTASSPPVAGDAPPCNSDSGDSFDVVVFYSNVARTAAGGTADIEAEVQLAVDVANQSYETSQINGRLRLKHCEEITYNEDGTFDEHLSRLRDTTDGIMDTVHTRRDQYGADFVSLFVDDDDATASGSVCGLAYVMTTLSSGFEDYALSVVNWDCAAGNFSFAHELGHNMGCQHDRANAGVGLYSYSYGWRFTGSSGTQWRTVMAYSPGTRIGYFSNPSVAFDGIATGVAVGSADEANNALTINNSAYTVANWRRSAIWVDVAYTGGTENGCFNYPYRSLTAGEAAVPIGGTLWIQPGTYVASGAHDKAMTMHAPSGAVTLGD